MTLPLMALAVGAMVAGFVSIPPALGGGAVLEHFLEPSLTAEAATPRVDEAGRGRRSRPKRRRKPPRTAHEEPHISHMAELGLMRSRC